MAEIKQLLLKKAFIKIILLCIILIASFPSNSDNASEREYIKEQDPEISEALGIGTLQFEDCFYAENSNSQYYSQNKLLPCLQQYNPDINQELLNSVLDQYRPER